MTWLTPSLGLFGGLVGSFFGSYVKKKGENYATREDLKDLTRIAEETKAAVTDKSWDRQRHWEMKRDAILEVIQATSLVHDDLTRWAALHAFPISKRNDRWEQDHHVFRARFDELYMDYRRKRSTASFLSGTELNIALFAFGGAITNASLILIAQTDFNTLFNDANTLLVEGAKLVRSSARKELRLPPLDETGP